MSHSYRALRHFRPILERRYHERTKLYLWGDADDTAFTITDSGAFTADLRKTAIFALSGALLVFLVLKRR